MTAQLSHHSLRVRPAPLELDPPPTEGQNGFVTEQPLAVIANQLLGCARRRRGPGRVNRTSARGAELRRSARGPAQMCCRSTLGASGGKSASGVEADALCVALSTGSPREGGACGRRTAHRVPMQSCSHNLEFYWNDQNREPAGRSNCDLGTDAGF